MKQDDIELRKELNLELYGAWGCVPVEKRVEKNRKPIIIREVRGAENEPSETECPLFKDKKCGENDCRQRITRYWIVPEK